MLRGLLCGVLLFGLGACSAEDFDRRGAADPVCSARAEFRASDAAVNGFRPGLQQKIYDSAYKDCLIWAPKNTVNGFR